MLISKINYNLISDIIRLKDVVKESVDAVMDERLTASHLASDVYALLDALDMLENEWRGTPPTEETPEAEEAPPAEGEQTEQPAPEGQQ